MYSVRSYVLTALNINTTIFSEMTQYILVQAIDVSVESTACSLVVKIKLSTLAACSVYSANLKMEAVRSS